MFEAGGVLLKIGDREHWTSGNRPFLLLWRAELTKKQGQEMKQDLDPVEAWSSWKRRLDMDIPNTRLLWKIRLMFSGCFWAPLIPFPNRQGMTESAAAAVGVETQDMEPKPHPQAQEATESGTRRLKVLYSSLNPLLEWFFERMRSTRGSCALTTACILPCN